MCLPNLKKQDNFQKLFRLHLKLLFFLSLRQGLAAIWQSWAIFKTRICRPLLQLQLLLFINVQRKFKISLSILTYQTDKQCQTKVSYQQELRVIFLVNFTYDRILFFTSNLKISSISFQNFNSRTALLPLVGFMWPTGRSLPTPDLRVFK